jgi:hypothetical protein
VGAAVGLFTTTSPETVTVTFSGAPGSASSIKVILDTFINPLSPAGSASAGFDQTGTTSPAEIDGTTLTINQFNYNVLWPETLTLSGTYQPVWWMTYTLADNQMYGDVPANFGLSPASGYNITAASWLWYEIVMTWDTAASLLVPCMVDSNIF